MVSTAPTAVSSELENPEQSRKGREAGQRSIEAPEEIEVNELPVNFFPLTRASPLGSLVFLKTAGAWQTAAVIFLAL